jgi:hypothetical protein
VALDGRALPRALGDAVTFARIDDGFFDHPKVLRAGEDAANLYVRALVWCNKHLTDGAIPREALRALTGRRDAPSLADRLVAVGLWETTAEGWSVHDFLCFNAQRKDVLAQRAELSRKRAEAGKQGGLRSGEVRKTKQVASTLLEANEANGKPHPIPSHPIPEEKEESPLPPGQAKPAVGKLSAADVDDVLQRESGGRIDVRSANAPKLALLALLGEMAVTPTELAAAARLCRTPSAVWPWAEGLKADRSRVTVTWLVGGEGAPRLHELVAAARAASPPPMPTPHPTISDAQMRRLSPFAGLLERTRTRD